MASQEDRKRIGREPPPASMGMGEIAGAGLNAAFMASMAAGPVKSAVASSRARAILQGLLERANTHGKSMDWVAREFQRVAESKYPKLSPAILSKFDETRAVLRKEWVDKGKGAQWPADVLPETPTPTTPPKTPEGPAVTAAATPPVPVGQGEVSLSVGGTPQPPRAPDVRPDDLLDELQNTASRQKKGQKWVKTQFVERAVGQGANPQEASDLYQRARADRTARVEQLSRRAQEGVAKDLASKRAAHAERLAARGAAPDVGKSVSSGMERARAKLAARQTISAPTPTPPAPLAPTGAPSAPAMGVQGGQLALFDQPGMDPVGAAKKLVSDAKGGKVRITPEMKAQMRAAAAKQGIPMTSQQADAAARLIAKNADKIARGETVTTYGLASGGRAPPETTTMLTGPATTTPPSLGGGGPATTTLSIPGSPAPGPALEAAGSEQVMAKASKLSKLKGLAKWGGIGAAVAATVLALRHMGRLREERQESEDYRHQLELAKMGAGAGTQGATKEDMIAQALLGDIQTMRQAQMMAVMPGYAESQAVQSRTSAQQQQSQMRALQMALMQQRLTPNEVQFGGE